MAISVALPKLLVAELLLTSASWIGVKVTGLIASDGLIEALGLTDAETEADGEVEALGLVDAETELEGL